MNNIIIIFGPTGVGKSDAAERLAHKLGGKAAILNLDMGSCYAPLTIGTAKPAWRTNKIPHYLFDIVHEPRNITVVEYREVLLKTVNMLWAQGIMPILVGGSSFYLKTLLFPPIANILSVVPTEQNKVGNDLWQELFAVDPDRARAIHPSDIYRLERALSIWKTTGEKPSLLVPKYNPPSHYTLLFLTRERADLHDRINTRVREMISAGWVDEVARLKGTTWEPFLRAKKIIGYDDILSYLDGTRSLEETITLIQQKTRAYAKRQHTFWRGLERQLLEVQATRPDVDTTIASVNLTCGDIDLYISQLSKTIIEK